MSNQRKQWPLFDWYAGSSLTCLFDCGTFRLWWGERFRFTKMGNVIFYSDSNCKYLMWEFCCYEDLVGKSNSLKSLISVLNRHHINSQMNFSQIPKSWKSLMWEFGLMWKWSGAAGGCVPLTIRSSLGQASRRAELGNSTNRKFTKKIAQKQCLEFCLNIVKNAK